LLFFEKGIIEIHKVLLQDNDIVKVKKH